METMTQPNLLDETVTGIDCFEPADLGRLELTGDDLTRNTLFVGSTGSGKTTLMNGLAKDIISFHAADAARKTGLLIIDFKQDETLDNIRAWCRACGRESDIVVIDQQSAHYFDPMADFRGPADVDRLVDLVVSTIPRSFGGNNEYFEAVTRKRLTHFLTIYGVHAAEPCFIEALRMVLEWLGSSGKPELECVEHYPDFYDELPRSLDPAVEAQFTAALHGLKEWENHDVRTRSNEASTISNHLGSFLRPGALRCLHGSPEGAVDLRSIVEEGKIVVVRMPGATRPEESGVVGRVIKGGFYDAVMARKVSREGDDRLVGLICDEAPLIISDGEGRYSDITQMAVLRSRKAFFLGGTQGFAVLDRRIGGKNREALLANVNNWFVLRNQEPEVAHFAGARFGERVEEASDCYEVAPGVDGGASLRQTIRRIPVLKPICGLDALANLRTHQCFVQISSRECVRKPVWLQPLYSEAYESASGSEPVESEISFAALRLREEEEAPIPRPMNMDARLTTALQHYVNATGKNPNVAVWEDKLDLPLGCGDLPKLRRFFDASGIPRPETLGPFPYGEWWGDLCIHFVRMLDQIFDLRENPLTTFGFFGGILLCERAGVSASDPRSPIFYGFVAQLQDIAMRWDGNGNYEFGFEL